MELRSISIIGLGLIGGSLVKAIRKSDKNINIYAIDSNTSSLRLAEAEGVINEGFTQCGNEIWESDIIFVCTPIREAMSYIKLLSSKVKSNCIITDVASTKGEICQYAEALEAPPIFIGGHPMAGTEASGYSNSFPHLYENAYYVLTPTKTSTKASIDTLKSLLINIGAIPIIVPPQKHDLVTGCISHVPHIVASALVTLANNNKYDTELIKLLAAGGFRDITRIASSNPYMWENVVLSNSNIIIDLLNDYKVIVDKIIENIKTSNNSEVYSFFDNAKAFRDSFSTSSAGLIPRSFEIIADIEDEPGIIGSIATLLGKNSINIKNINVSNSREFEQGCLIITLSDQCNADRAFEILSSNSYKVFRKD